jgi:DNA-binding response OmpR family regulator
VGQKELVGNWQLTVGKTTSDIDNRQPTTDNSLLLIVEDNTDLRLYIRGILDKDYQVMEAGDGRQGLERALEHVPDLVLTDVMMPEMDGYELSRKLKSDERTSHIPVILLTPRASMESKVEGLETGADDFITKPFDPHELQVRIQNLITQRKKLKESYLNELGLPDLAVKGKVNEGKLVSLDQRFLLKARTVVEEHLADEKFDIEQFSDEMNLSRTQVHRKLRALINQSATEFIRTVRLNYSRMLLSHKTGNISEIALEVGFSNPGYFSECFRKQFGLTPSAFVNSKKHPDR